MSFVSVLFYCRVFWKSTFSLKVTKSNTNKNENKKVDLLIRVLLKVSNVYFSTNRP